MPLKDADKLKEAMERMLCTGKEPDKERYTCDVVCCVIDEAPTVDAEPVRHAKYIHVGPSFNGGVDWYRCSNCSTLESGVYVQHPFCSICGAKMDEGGQNAAN